MRTSTAGKATTTTETNSTSYSRFGRDPISILLLTRVVVVKERDSSAGAPPYECFMK